jgi:hypothetical protein
MLQVLCSCLPRFLVPCLLRASLSLVHCYRCVLSNLGVHVAVGPITAEQLSRLQDLPSLRDISLSQCLSGVDSAVVGQLLLHCRTLVTIDLSGSENSLFFGAGCLMPRSGNNIGESGARAIAEAMPSCPALSSLDLSGIPVLVVNGVTDPCVQGTGSAKREHERLRRRCLRVLHCHR